MVIVELSTAVVFAFLWMRFEGLGIILSYSLVAAVLILITVIDMEHRLILNIVVLPSTLVALALSPYLVQSRSALISGFTSIVGIAVGYILVFGIYLFGRLFVNLMARRRGSVIDEVAFGMGDVKLAGLAGALVGFPAVLYVLVYAILIGGIVSFLVLIYQIIVKRHYSAFMAIPYGPFITVAVWFVMIWGREFIAGLAG